MVTLIQKAILMFIYTHSGVGIFVESNGTEDEYRTYIDKRNMEIDKLHFWTGFRYYIEHFIEFPCNKEIMDSFAYLELNGYLKANVLKDTSILYNYLLLEKGKQYCDNNDIEPIKLNSKIGYIRGK